MRGMKSAPLLGEDLKARLGAPRKVRTLDSSPRSQVWSATLDGTPAVIKHLLAGPGADERFAREVAALRAAAAVQPPVVPRLLGADPAQRVVVTERIMEQSPPADWVVGYAAALGRLHSAPTEDAELPAWSGPTSADVEAFLKLAAWLGTPAGEAVGAELDALVTRQAARSPRAELLHGDPCPANDLHTPDGVRFVDFEQASLGDGMVELAYLRIGFPTCWCATSQPPELLAEAEAAYADAAGRPVDDLALADACTSWTIRGDALVQRAHRETQDHLARLTVEDWKWWKVSARDRLAYRLGVVGGLADADGPLAQTACLATRMRNAMLERWKGLRPLPTKRP